ncbi:hypothetical protein VNO78_22915 [Psophocarpus tetragonolobus]|uniref:Uncharacterized protein n=1 Tax=Psophocarpus tetragonolobus TaxID=3891 RepID=A0AAN9XCX8_PSOTE
MTAFRRLIKNNCPTNKIQKSRDSKHYNKLERQKKISEGHRSFTGSLLSGLLLEKSRNEMRNESRRRRF